MRKVSVYKLYREPTERDAAIKRGECRDLLRGLQMICQQQRKRLHNFNNKLSVDGVNHSLSVRLLVGRNRSNGGMLVWFPAMAVITAIAGML